MNYLSKTIIFCAGLLAVELSLTSIQAAAGDLYDGGLNSHAIYKFTPAGVQTVFVSNADPNFNDADWLAFDSKGTCSLQPLLRSRRSLRMAQSTHRLPQV